MHTAALRGTRFSEARFVFMDLIMSTKRMVLRPMITRLAGADRRAWLQPRRNQFGAPKGTPYLFL